MEYKPYGQKALEENIRRQNAAIAAKKQAEQEKQEAEQKKISGNIKKPSLLRRLFCVKKCRRVTCGKLFNTAETAAISVLPVSVCG